MTVRVLRLLLVLWLAWSAPALAQDSVRVGVLLSGAGTSYWAVLEGLRGELETALPQARLEVVTLAETAPSADALADLRTMQLIVAVGTRAARAARRLPDGIPVLSVFLPRHAYSQVFSASRPQRAVSAIYLEQPLSRQFAFVRALRPDAAVVGAVLGPSSAHRKPALRQAAEGAGFTLDAVEISGDDRAVTAMKRLVGRADVLLAVPDAAVFTPNRAKWLLYMAYRRNTPLVGFSRPYVEAGALGSIFSTPAQVGRQAAGRIRRWHREGALGPPAFPLEFEVAVNRFTARALGIRVPEAAALRRAVETGEVPQ